MHLIFDPEMLYSENILGSLHCGDNYGLNAHCCMLKHTWMEIGLLLLNYKKCLHAINNIPTLSGCLLSNRERYDWTSFRGATVPNSTPTWQPFHRIRLLHNTYTIAPFSCTHIYFVVVVFLLWDYTFLKHKVYSFLVLKNKVIPGGNYLLL